MGRPPKPPEKRKSARYHLQMEEARLERYKRAAEAAGVELAEWIRRQLDDACRDQGIE